MYQFSFRNMSKIVLLFFLFNLFIPSLVVRGQSGSTFYKKKVTISQLEQETRMTRTRLQDFLDPANNYDSLDNLIKRRLNYPVKAKQNFLEHTVLVNVSIDIEGHTKFNNIISDPYPLFDSVALNGMLILGKSWKHGISGYQNRDANITVPVKFGITHADSIVYFVISYFDDLNIIVDDSTSTFPSFMALDNKECFTEKQRNLVNNFYLTIDPKKELNDQFGRIELGFEVDSNGTPGQLQVYTSSASIMDSEAIKKVLENKWLPARKKGINVTSFKVFNFLFDRSSKVECGREINQYFGDTRVSHLHELALQDGHNNYLEHKYQDALVNFKKASNWYYNKPELFFDKALTEVNLKKGENACDDFQRCYELSEQYGYPQGLTAEKITTILKENCQ